MSITTTSAPPLTGTWAVDPDRSRVGFQVKQLGLSSVRGTFSEFEGTLELGDGLAGSRAYGSVSVASLDTHHKRRDAHLRSPDFLDAERYPELTFEASEIRPLDAETVEIAGDLTLHGVTRPVVLTAALQGTEEGPRGEQRIALAVAGRLQRGDYGVTPSPLLDVLVSEEVELRLHITAVKQA
jgi:polyisoprenoid-binding protein YceI